MACTAAIGAGGALLGGGAAMVNALGGGGGGGGSGTQTVINKTEPPPEFMAAYKSLLDRGQTVANQPLQQYSGPMIAGFTPAQLAAFNTVNGSQGMADPFINSAAQYAGAGAASIGDQTPLLSNEAAASLAGNGIATYAKPTQNYWQSALASLPMLLAAAGIGSPAYAGMPPGASAPPGQYGQAQSSLALPPGVTTPGPAGLPSAAVLPNATHPSGVAPVDLSRGAPTAPNIGGIAAPTVNFANPTNQAPGSTPQIQDVTNGMVPGVNASTIGSFMDPYNDAVISSTLKGVDRQNRVDQQRLIGNAISAGAWGGDRAGIAQAELINNQGDSRAQLEAQLRSGAYSQALAAAQQQQQTGLAKAGLGIQQENVGLGQQQIGLGQGQLELGKGNLALGAGQLTLAQQQAQQDAALKNYLGTTGVALQQQQQLGSLGLGQQAQNTAMLQTTGGLGLGQQAQNTAQMQALGQLSLGQENYGLGYLNTTGNLSLGQQQIGLGQSAQALQGLGLGINAASTQDQNELARANASMTAYNQSVDQARQAAAQTGALNLQAAQTTGNLGISAQQAALSGASAQLQSGALQQQLAQEQLNVPYQQFQQQQNYPFYTTNFLGQLVSGVGGLAGGTTNSATTTPGASPYSQLAGLGMTGLGLYNMGAQNGWWGGNAPMDSSGLMAATAVDPQSIWGFNDGGRVEADDAPAEPGFPILRSPQGVPRSSIPVPQLAPRSSLGVPVTSGTPGSLPVTPVSNWSPDAPAASGSSFDPSQPSTWNLSPIDWSAATAGAGSGASPTDIVQHQAQSILQGGGTPEDKAQQWQQMQQALSNLFPNYVSPTAVTSKTGDKAAVLNNDASTPWIQRIEQNRDAVQKSFGLGTPDIGAVAGPWYFDPQGGMYEAPPPTPRPGGQVSSPPLSDLLANLDAFNKLNGVAASAAPSNDLASPPTGSQIADAGLIDIPLADVFDLGAGPASAPTQPKGNVFSGIHPHFAKGGRARYDLGGDVFETPGLPEIPGMNLYGDSDPYNTFVPDAQPRARHLTAPRASEGIAAKRPDEPGIGVPPSALPVGAPTASDSASSPWEALTAAGLATMSGTSPNGLTNIGQGGLYALKYLEQQRAQADAKAEKAQEFALKKGDTEARAKQIAAEIDHYRNEDTRAAEGKWTSTNNVDSDGHVIEVNDRSGETRQGPVLGEDAGKKEDRELRRKDQESEASYRKRMADLREREIEQGRFTWQPGLGADPKDPEKQVAGSWRFPTRGDEEPKFIPGAVQTGKPSAGGGGTALTKNAQFLVDNKIAPDLASAVKVLRTGVNDSATQQRLIQAEKKLLQSQLPNLSADDPTLEARARANVAARFASARQEAAAPDAESGADQPTAAAPTVPQRPAAVPPGARYSPSQKSWWWQENGQWKSKAG